MFIPFVIDNQQQYMRVVLNALLAQYKGRSLDIATTRFSIDGWQLICNGLKELGTFRLLIGDEPVLGTSIGMCEAGIKPIKELIRKRTEADFNEHMLRLVEDLVAFLQQDRVQVHLYTGSFLHTNSYLFYADRSFTRIAPLAAIVGSSNFTQEGLLSNKELNLVYRANLTQDETRLERLCGIMEEDERLELVRITEQQRTLAADIPGLLALDALTTWYRRQWREARDFKTELIELLRTLN